MGRAGCSVDVCLLPADVRPRRAATEANFINETLAYLSVVLLVVEHVKKVCDLSTSDSPAAYLIGRIFFKSICRTARTPNPTPLLQMGTPHQRSSEPSWSEWRSDYDCPSSCLSTCPGSEADYDFHLFGLSLNYSAY